MCQYSIDDYDPYQSSLNEIIYQLYSHKYEPTTFTCYVHLQCNRGSALSCLDWSEICDEKIDCIDGGHDEEYCWQLEINDCGNDEYRCNIEQCIPYAFFRDDSLIPNCLDAFDEVSKFQDKRDNCDKSEPTFACEDVTICDGYTELIPITINGLNETECEQWQYNNTYTRCDDFWNCLYRADEIDCDSLSLLACSLHHHIFLSTETKRLTYLSIEKANDGKIDCFGAIVEPKFCRENHYLPSDNNFLLQK
ncbi:unnamed protein product [Rotaria sp. Silwood1]|nr:unnamed protein product [Rotaria sp. Silwood1]